MIGQLILLFIVAQLAVGHPFYQKQFETIVNRDQCLKKCMIPVQEFGKELSLMKNTNLGAYFDRYAETCTTIVQARQCVNDCGIESNPFELDIMMTHCSFETRQKIDTLMPCFKDNGEKINDLCVKTCGNYENLNDFLSDMTKDLKSLDDKTKLDEIMFGRNHACGIYKCMTKCNVEQTQNHCGIETALLLENVLKNIVVSQRHDLERLNLVEVMAKSLPPSCDYFYAPDALFPPQPTVPMMNAAPLPEHLPIQIPNEPKQLTSIPLETFRAPTGQMVHVVYHPLPEDVQRPPQPIAEIQPIRSDVSETIDHHPEHPVTHPTTDIQSQEPVVPEPTPETPEENSENIPIEEPKPEIQPETTPIEHPTENISETHPETIKNIPTQEIPNLEQILQQAQLTMISKQMHVLEKQEQILDKENNKLDYELFQQKNSPKFF